jgi:hypothetical protein
VGAETGNAVVVRRMVLRCAEESYWDRVQWTTRKKKLLRAMLECFLLLLDLFDRAGVSLGKGRGARSSRCNGVRRVELK